MLDKEKNLNLSLMKKAAECIAKGLSNDEVSKKYNIPRNVLTMWKKDKRFKDMIKAFKKDTREECINAIVCRSLPLSIERLNKIITNGEDKNAVTAINKVLELCFNPKNNDIIWNSISSKIDREIDSNNKSIDSSSKEVSNEKILSLFKNIENRKAE